MAAIVDELWGMADRLRQERDELRVQMNLGRKEARDEWAELEGKWERFQSRVQTVKDEVEDVAEDVGDDAKTAALKLGKEIRTGYERIRDSID